jgi:hypothetical protein
MRFKIVIVMLAVAVLSFAMVGSAAAKPLGVASKHKPAPPPQVTGSQLEAVLLPPSAFGSNLVFAVSLDTGRRLQSTRATKHVPSLSCAVFENTIYVAFLGDTAGADLGYSNPAPRPAYPNGIVYGYEDVVQFATATAASTLYNQDRAKYAACQSFTYTVSGKAWHGSTLSVSNTTVNGDRAFVVNESITVQGLLPLYYNFLYVVASTNVYSIIQLTGAQDEPSPTLMGDLIGRVQALYRHH